MRMSICAQSQASVPPVPAWMREEGITGVLRAVEHGPQLELVEALLERRAARFPVPASRLASSSDSSSKVLTSSAAASRSS